MPNSTVERNAAARVELRSEELNEIISKVPSVLIRWGISLFFLILVLILVGCYFIKYPDVVNASFELTSQNAPKPVVTHVDGKLVQLFTEEGAKVRKGQVVALMESTADYQDVVALSSWLDSLSLHLVQHDDGVIGLQRPHFNRLGELQAAYQLFDQAYVEMLSILPDGYYTSRKRFLKQELANNSKLRRGLEAQRILFERDFKIAEANFKIQESLYAQKVIAVTDLQREESKLVLKEIPLQQMEAALVENLSMQTAKEKEILELEKRMSEQKNAFRQALSVLESSISDWKRSYLLRASADGVIHFNSFVQENQYLQAGQEIFYVAAVSSREFGEAQIPQYNLGKLAVGQTVLIKFESYPFQEFGLVRGKVEFISEIPTKDGAYIAKVGLPEGLMTTHHKQLTYRAGMTATAEVVTENRRLLDKIFHGLKQAMAE